MTIRRIALFALMALATVPAFAAPARAREWFVRAGSEGGGGGRRTSASSGTPATWRRVPERSGTRCTS